MVEILWILLLSAILVVIVLKVFPVKRVIVYEYQRGLRYRSGHYISTLGPGLYWVFPIFSTIVTIDVRPESITISGQDVISADGVTLKVSLAAEFQVADPNVAVNKTANFRTGLYLSLQMALREIVGRERIDAILENRAGFGAKLMEISSKKASEYGLKLISADVKDIMFPGEMKKAFAQVVRAQKEGQAALERARGETSALRSLANAARMMDGNPNLLHLRALQALEVSSGNTLMLGLPNGTVPILKQGEKSAIPPSKERDKGEG
jgi:regulator of protease activity HflC (stomatin/prohibitin superfamily)